MIWGAEEIFKMNLFFPGNPFHIIFFPQQDLSITNFPTPSPPHMFLNGIALLRINILKTYEKIFTKSLAMYKHKATLTIFYVQRVLRHAKILPDTKKKLAFSCFFSLRHGTEQSSYGFFFVFTFSCTDKNAH